MAETWFCCLTESLSRRYVETAESYEFKNEKAEATKDDQRSTVFDQIYNFLLEEVYALAHESNFVMGFWGSCQVVADSRSKHPFPSVFVLPANFQVSLKSLKCGVSPVNEEEKICMFLQLIMARSSASNEAIALFIEILLLYLNPFSKSLLGINNHFWGI